MLAVVLLAEAPLIAGFALAGRNFTGSATAAKYVADSAQHELWADQMARHGRFLANLLTPEHTPAGWLFNPLEFAFGMAGRITNLPYVFGKGTDPRPLIRRFGVTWVVIDTERGTPRWARGTIPARRFDSTIVLAAGQLTR